MSRRLTVVLVALLLGLAACSEDDGGAVIGGASSETTAVPTVPTVPAPGTGARVVTPTPRLLSPSPAAIDSASLRADGQLEVRFYGGVEACYGVDRVEVTESDTEVTVTVLTGGKPEAAGQACIDLAELQAVVVTLSQPLGSRTVIDGSTGGPVTIG